MLDLIIKIIAAIGGPIAALWALIQWRESLLQRKREFRWNQIKMGKELLDELFEDDVAGEILELIDNESSEITLKNGTKIQVSSNDIRSALLHSNSSENTEKNAAIRKGFDYLLYRLERIQRCVELGLVTTEDISAPTGYYCNMLKKHSEELNQYIEYTNYFKAKHLIDNLQTEQVLAWDN